MRELLQRRGPAPYQARPSTFAGVLQRRCACGGSDAQDGERKDYAMQLKEDRGLTRTMRAIHDSVTEVVGSSGAALDSKTRSSMEQRFSDLSMRPALKVAQPLGEPGLTANKRGDAFEQEADRTSQQIIHEPQLLAQRPAYDFTKVRVHTDSRAAASARSVGALAYTVGNDIVFGSGQYDPRSECGQRLLAHELTHTLQQGGSGHVVMGVWDKAETECASAPKDRWIDKVVVNQEVPQTVTIHWTDDSTESDECSTGKGHCCVDDANPSGIACTAARSHVEGTNCTPITLHMGYPVVNRVLDHKGVHFWSEFVPSPRFIALHQYDDIGVVNGTPLSHGCVRLHEAMAKKIFCGVRQNQTWVQVQGFARPKCNTPALQKVWEGDFAEGGLDLSTADGDEKAEIYETRKELNDAFGRTLSVDEIRKLTAADIPHCSSTAPLPKPAAPAGGASGSGKTAE